MTTAQHNYRNRSPRLAREESDRLRLLVLAKIGRLKITYPQAAADMGMPPRTLGNWMGGRPLAIDLIKTAEAWSNA